MLDLPPVLNGGVTSDELDRRRHAVRAAMAEAGIDVLLMQSSQDCLGGYVRYFLNIVAAGGYPLTIIFPRDDEMSIIQHGPHGQDVALPEAKPALMRGVARLLTTPSFCTASYTRYYDAEAADRVLKRYVGGTVGLVGPGTLPYPFMQHLLANSLAKATIVDASPLVDDIKAVKSAEEIAQVRLTCAAQDAVMREVTSAVRPDMTERDLGLVAGELARRAGSDQGVTLCGTAPVGYATGIRPPLLQGGRIADGNQIHLLIEFAGQAGFWAELGRTIVLGRASQEMHDELGFVHEARDVTLKMLRPGVPCAEIWNEYNAFMRSRGREEEQRVHCHSQGYDVVERPLVRWDDPAVVAENMVFAVHPTYRTPTSHNWLCDNYLVTSDGPVRLHETPETIIELG